MADEEASGTYGAVLTAAEIVGRLQTAGLGARITDAWRAFVASMGLPAELDDLVLDPGRVEISSRFHGHDERIDVASVGLSTRLWLDVVDDLLD